LPKSTVCQTRIIFMLARFCIFPLAAVIALGVSIINLAHNLAIGSRVVVTTAINRVIRSKVAVITAINRTIRSRVVATTATNKGPVMITPAITTITIQATRRATTQITSVIATPAAIITTVTKGLYIHAGQRLYMP
jgi:hypothetical protein